MYSPNTKLFIILFFIGLFGLVLDVVHVTLLSIQIKEEFRRITTIFMEQSFLYKLEHYMPKLISLMKAKGGVVGTGQTESSLFVYNCACPQIHAHCPMCMHILHTHTPSFYTQLLLCALKPLLFAHVFSCVLIVHCV